MNKEDEVACDLKTKKDKVRWILLRFPEAKKDDYDFFWLYTFHFQSHFIKYLGQLGEYYLAVPRSRFKELEILKHSVLAIRQTLQKKYPELRDEDTWNKRHHRGKKFETEILKVN